MVKVLQKGDKTLEKTAEEITLGEIQSPEIKGIISEMKDVLKNTDDAIALAGPQIGKSLRIFIVSNRFFEKNNKKDLIFINPKIVKLSKEKQWMEEGCLSVRDVYGEVERSKKTLISALDEHGKKFTFGSSGLLSQVFQHEVDHLNGVLFTTKAKNLRKEKSTGSTTI
ncbi:MAG: peptide deformylase [Patescibacteria group bacterium]|nr:peptide deformylase [Patescibacteria group bacterium]